MHSLGESSIWWLFFFNYRCYFLIRKIWRGEFIWALSIWSAFSTKHRNIFYAGFGVKWTWLRNSSQMDSVLWFFFLIIGAGFYLNATQEKWKNWRMYDYVVKELPKLLSENFSQLDTSRASISGHSMGGHGALTIYLKNLDKYKVHEHHISSLHF